MTTTFSAPTTNPHIAALETLFAEATMPIEWLVIAHNDSLMLRSLSSALAGEAAAVLEVSQHEWDFEGEQLPETIEWALQQGQLKHLMLVGNSQAGGPSSRASLVASEETGGNESGCAKLLAGVERNHARTRDAQQRFASHVQQMLQIPVVHHRWSSGELAVYGLFYRADSGLFLAYDMNANSFHALLAQG